MKGKEKTTRREFITKTGILTAGVTIPFAKAFGSYLAGSAESKFPIRLFTKPLDIYDFDFMCECAVLCGIMGLDLVVRPKGRVEPSVVEKELPERIAEAKKFNLVTDMMVSGITDASDSFTERVLKTASESGIKYYRLGWLDYETGSDIWQSLQKSRLVIRKIAELNKKYEIHGGYQNHAGPGVGGPVWDLYELLRDIPADFLGSQYDVRHAMVEGANTWILGMRLLAPHIRTLAIKDFTWITNNGKPRAVTVPLGEGMVNWNTYFNTLKELKIVGPITLHVEYPLLEKGEEKLSLTQQQAIIVSKIKKDVDFVNLYLNKYQLI